jgi:phosphoglycerate dehydrogenase-like enzyme
MALLNGSDAAIVSTDPFTRRVLESQSTLRIIARVGVGTDSIDHVAALERKVAISITPGMNAEPVADHTIAMLLALVRRIVVQDGLVKAGRWERVGSYTPSELPGKTIGLLGAGTIGQAVIRRLLGFGCRIVYFDTKVDYVHDATKLESLEELLKVSDAISLHAPLTPETHRIINSETIRLMKPGALLVNTSRGSLVDQQALLSALMEGRLGGAALDVFEVEPPAADQIADTPNLICSPHIGGLSHESIQRMTASATSSVLSILAGERPDTVINPEIWGA